MNAFKIRCSREIFTEKEIGILERYGGELERLANGKRLPTTEARRRFVAAARHQRPPESIYEKTWAKYVLRDLPGILFGDLLGIPWEKKRFFLIFHKVILSGNLHGVLHGSGGPC